MVHCHTTLLLHSWPDRVAWRIDLAVSRDHVLGSNCYSARQLELPQRMAIFTQKVEAVPKEGARGVPGPCAELVLLGSDAALSL